jgi:pimeloyl-ACP methyl ester carboxylesterase
MRMSEATREAIEVHRSRGHRFRAQGVESFVRDQGDGVPVVLFHGVPTSSFLYRKLVPALAERGLRGVAFDMPGLGLAERPTEFDYSWSGLAKWSGEAIDALGITRCHLVVHDIGGPIGCEWAVRNPERVLSLTVLNTMLNLGSFRRPWTMRPFAVRGLGELWLASLNRFVMSELFYSQGIADRSAVPRAEVYAHYVLLRGADRGRAFLRIMRGFELTEQKERFLHDGFLERPYPVRIVWGEKDPALGPELLRAARRTLGVNEEVLLPAKHFVPEDHAPQIASEVADLAGPLA